MSRPSPHRIVTLRPGEQVQVLGQQGQLRVRALDGCFDVQDRGKVPAPFYASITTMLLFEDGASIEFRLERSTVSVRVSRAEDGHLEAEQEQGR